MLAIGRSAVAAYRHALATVGTNVANAQTAGYVRRRSDLAELPLGSGVAAIGTSRSHDAFASGAVRTAAERSGRADTGSLWLGRIETVLETGDGGVGTSLSRFFSAGARLAADPGSTTLRTGFIDALDAGVAAFNRAGAGLDDVATALRVGHDDAVESVNDSLDGLAQINAALRREPAGTIARAGLEDERDRLLDGLAATTGFSATFASDGSVTLTALDAAEPPLLDPAGPATLSLLGADGTLQIAHPAGTRPFAPSTGALAGLAESRAALDRRSADLDSLAASFVTALNAWSAAGTTASGAPGAPLLTGSTAQDLKTTAMTPADIAAARGGEANGNMLALDGMRASGGFEQRWDAMVSANASMLARGRAEAAAATLASEQAIGARDALSRAELDDEAADLLALQQGYNAAARILQVSRETIDTLLTRL